MRFGILLPVTFFFLVPVSGVASIAQPQSLLGSTVDIGFAFPDLAPENTGSYGIFRVNGQPTYLDPIDTLISISASTSTQSMISAQFTGILLYWCQAISDTGCGDPYGGFVFSFTNAPPIVGVSIGPNTTGGYTPQPSTLLPSGNSGAAYNSSQVFVNFDSPSSPPVVTSGSQLELDVQTATCAQVLQQSVYPLASGTQMTATFLPLQGRATLQEAEAACGVSNFNWQQTIDALPTPNPFYVGGSQASAPPPFLDPVPGGWDATSPSVPGCPALPVGNAGEDSFPFYWGLSELSDYENQSGLRFSDIPTDVCLPAGDFMYFTTTLVGVDANGNPVPLPVDDSFKWRDNFNGTVGTGVQALKNTLPANPGSGTGGAELLSTPEPKSFALVFIVLTGILLRRNGRG